MTKFLLYMLIKLHKNQQRVARFPIVTAIVGQSIKASHSVPCLTNDSLSISWKYLHLHQMKSFKIGITIYLQLK